MSFYKDGFRAKRKKGFSGKISEYGDRLYRYINRDSYNTKIDIDNLKNLTPEEVIERGTLLSRFWGEWSKSRDYRDIDFMRFKDLRGLKRESLLNSILIHLKSLSLSEGIYHLRG